ncbi:hypothetical protein GSI_01763 [Ganoderma sinense ZZ0214-1]|uniref:GLTSCR protein conserved domain-containing protein n=1 Tax=Ganoderma sinense ZZ0214-1 TaxID=1077348 RepID=A0A2G8SQW5_9APHY|nr:hypothetical protein GSI_01763 [Ganoderma sinense ZZ0214-1]
MSSIAGPSTHTFSSFSVHPRQPPAISTKLRRVQDAPDSAAPPSSIGTGTPVPATPILTTAPTTAPPTPIIRSSSQATDPREPSQDPAGSVAPSFLQNGTAGATELGPPSARTSRASVAVDLDAVNARAIALSREHKRGVDEEAVMVQTAARIASRLAEDHRAALFPDVDEPFVDELDVVRRLLPYHVFQLPREDLEGLLQNGTVLTSRKGKRKATEEDLLREEIADTKFAIECWKRRRALEQRFKKARNDSGKSASPSDQGYVIAQAVLEIERAENATLTAELRSARAELDKLEREKRAAATPPTSAASTPARPTPTVRTASTSNYYSSSTASTPTTATFMPPYRPPYSSYSQYPTTQYTYNPYAYSSYTPTTSTAYNTAPQTPASATSTTVYNPPASASMTTPTSTASAQVQQAAQTAGVSNTAIPVQLPVSSLPALAALGIIPVAAASVPPAGQPQPPAVIKSTNGTTLSLEINLSLLQSAQMSGLVLILNALTSRGVNVDGSSTFQVGSAYAAPPVGSSSVAQSAPTSGVATASLAGSKGSSAASTTSNTPAPSTSTSSTASTPAPSAGS